ncbi:MAG: FAD-binding oxidoreductase [Proteobacteria bacterium]|nr:FAD-binding oxidoreductase [Pseudomonadota bacterium]
MNCDLAVIGGGIAGAAIAYRMAPHCSVTLLERESQPGYHSTGRSAAGLSETLGAPAIRALTRFGRPFLETPPEGFAQAPLTRRRSWLFVGREDQRRDYDALCAEAGDGIEILDPAEAERLLPILRPGYAAHAALEPKACDLDVDAIHKGFLRGARAAGARFLTDAEVGAMSRRGGVWQIETTAGRIEAPVVVNAAGAWADAIALLAGVRPIGLVPKRRTALILDPPEGMDPTDWPELDDMSEEFYLKPEVGKLLASPADETPMTAQDAQPDEMDIAVCVERIQQATVLQVRRIEHSWAGLRSFVADRVPVIGFDYEAEGFFWLAGQGGAGIQTSPGLSEAAATLLRGQAWPAGLAALGLEPAMLSPARLTTRKEFMP